MPRHPRRSARVCSPPRARGHVRVSQSVSYTVCWGQGSGATTVHAGDRRGEHSDDYLVATVHGVGDWNGDEDVISQARKRAAPRARLLGH
jgi:hypothetical protein